MTEKHVPYTDYEEIVNALKKERRVLKKAKDMFWKFCKFKKYDRRKQMCEFDRNKHFVCSKENRAEKCPFYIVLKD